MDNSGTVQAHYEYSPFGKITNKTGTKQNDFDYRFSSEVFDIETGLAYYNYRYYSSLLGRWLSRDPIGEVGGTNLYGMVVNNSINKTDIRGQKVCCTKWEAAWVGNYPSLEKCFSEMFNSYLPGNATSLVEGSKITLLSLIKKGGGKGSLIGFSIVGIYALIAGQEAFRTCQQKTCTKSQPAALRVG